jgi:hypothetical protein
LHDVELPVRLDLEAVDAVSVTTVMDNLTDVFMPDQGPAQRAPSAARGRRPTRTMEGGAMPEVLGAEHGLSLVVTVTTQGRQHCLLYCTIPASVPMAWWRTCAGWPSIRPTSRPSCAATATSTTPAGSTG